MARVITVKGIGGVRFKPDQIEANMTLKTRNRDYDLSMSESTERLKALQEALVGIGFREEELKTAAFNVVSEYENVRDEKGNYRNEFAGYAVIHEMRLEFEFDTDLLSRVLSAISGSIADPELSVRFTVKDKNAVGEAALKLAARDARAKAEILAEASGVTLGQLLSIRYGCGEVNVYSPTNYRPAAKAMAMADTARMNFTPEDIEASDSVTFEWEIC